MADAYEKLASLPVAALRLDDDVITVLQRLGLKNLGQLLAIAQGEEPGRESAGQDWQQGAADQMGDKELGRDALQRRFRKGLKGRKSPSSNPLIRLDQILGKVPEPLLPVVPQHIPLVQRRLLEPLRYRALLDRAVADLAQDMVRELEGKGLGARRLDLGMWRVDGELSVRHLELAAATRDAAHICRLFADKLEDVDAGFGIEMLRLRASWCEPLAIAQGDFEAAAEMHGTSLSACLDRLSVRLGKDAVRRPVPWASHLPERSQRWQEPLAGISLTEGPSEGRGAGLSSTDQPSQGELALYTRPLKVLDRPERIAVLYAAPDGCPRRFRWRGNVHEVTRVEGPERIAPEWWRERGNTRLRDYYRIEDGAGARYWIFRQGIIGDGRGGAPDWYLQGLFA
jgi:protein ImuB